MELVCRSGQKVGTGLTGSHVSSNMLWSCESGLANWTFVVSAHDMEETKLCCQVARRSLQFRKTNNIQEVSLRHFLTPIHSVLRVKYSQ